MHDTDPQSLLRDEADGTVGFGPLRNSEELAFCGGLAHSILRSAGVALAKHYSQALDAEEARLKP